jgi:hypothetical protein
LKVLEVRVLFINATADDVIFFEHPMMQFSAQLGLIFGISEGRWHLRHDHSLCFDEGLCCVLGRVVTFIVFIPANKPDPEGVPCV